VPDPILEGGGDRSNDRAVDHDPLVCGLDCPELGKVYCPGCLAENRQAELRAQRRRQLQARLEAPATHRDALRLIRRELRRELSPIIAHLRKNK